MGNKPLYLTLLKRWFDLIKSGQKTREYREIKPYWTKRLVNREYSCIIFRNGYNKNSPTMSVEYLGYDIENINGISVYSLRLGKILEPCLRKG